MVLIGYRESFALETQTMISGDLSYVGKERFQDKRKKLGDVERMLKAMIKSLENKPLSKIPCFHGESLAQTDQPYYIVNTPKSL